MLSQTALRAGWKPPVEQPEARIERFEEYKQQLALSSSFCKSRSMNSQYHRLMFTLTELLSSGIEIVRDRKPFNFNGSMAMEASFDILNKISQPPADRHNEVLLIRFATAFVPFMEELNGYYTQPVRPSQPAKSEWQFVDYAQIAQEKARVEQNQRVQRVSTRNEPISDMAKIKLALNLNAPLAAPAKKPADAFRPVPNKNAALYIGMRNAVHPSPMDAPLVQPVHSSMLFTGGQGAYDPLLSTSDLPCTSKGVVKEEDTDWIKKEQPEYEEKNPSFLTDSTTEFLNGFNQHSGENTIEMKDELLDEFKDEPIDELQPLEPPIADRIVIRSTREEEEEAAAALAAQEGMEEISYVEEMDGMDGVPKDEPEEQLLEEPNRPTRGRKRAAPVESHVKPGKAVKTENPLTKRREMRLSTFAKHHYPEMIKTIEKKSAPTFEDSLREKKRNLDRAPPPPPLIPSIPKVVPKSHINPCRYCGVDCFLDKMESHVKIYHKDHWLKYVKKCPEKECDFRSDEAEDIAAHRRTVHNDQYISWKRTVNSARFKLLLKHETQKCPFCDEKLLGLAQFVSHMELFHRRICTYEIPYLECANLDCDFKTARCYEMFMHWQEASPECKDGIIFDYEEAEKISSSDATKKRQEYGVFLPSTRPENE